MQESSAYIGQLSGPDDANKHTLTFSLVEEKAALRKALEPFEVE